jgi:predicted RNase H-like nuclease (RuvC/YqgF family)
MSTELNVEEAINVLEHASYNSENFVEWFCAEHPDIGCLFYRQKEAECRAELEELNGANRRLTAKIDELERTNKKLRDSLKQKLADAVSSIAELPADDVVEVTTDDIGTPPRRRGRPSKATRRFREEWERGKQAGNGPLA